MENEFISDLQRNGLVIIQKKDGFRFGTDAVLLSDFCKDIKSRRTLDLCTGSGIVPILLYAKTKAEYICGVEIQTDVAHMAKRSVELNKIGERVEIICEDLKNLSLPRHSFDLVTVNPPYMKSGKGITNNADTVTLSRHETLCNLDDVVKAASEMLRDKGHFVMVHRPSRLADALCIMRKYAIEPKRLRFVHSTVGKEPSLFLVDGALHGGEELKILPPLIMKGEDGGESDELKQIYGRED